MAVFKDTNGRSWTVALDAPKIRDVRAEHNIDLVSPDEKTIQGILIDSVTTAFVLWTLCRSDAQAAGISEAMFHAAVTGDAIDRAEVAIMEAIVDFSPSHRRELLRSTVARAKNLREKANTSAMNMMADTEVRAAEEEALDAQVSQAREKYLQTLASFATTSPG